MGEDNGEDVTLLLLCFVSQHTQKEAAISVSMDLGFRMM